MLIPSTLDEETIRSTVERIDAILIPGGGDICPSLYGEEEREYTLSPNKDNDLFQMKAIEQALRLGKPILGICRGLQVLNVFFGGTLYQDIEKQFGGDCFRHMQSAPGYNPTHFVTVEKGSFLSELLPERAKTNSFHHQAAGECPGLNVSAMSDDGWAEAVEGRDGFVLGVQWHPEYLCGDEKQMRIFRALVEAAGRYGDAKNTVLPYNGRDMLCSG